MSSNYEARVLPETEYDRWTSFVDESAYGTVYSLPAYLDALSSATGGSFRVIGVEKGNALVGGIALYEERGAGGTRVVSPRLLLYYNGVVLRERESKYPSREVSEHLKVAAALAEYLAGAGHDRATLKSLPIYSDVRVFQQHGWSVHPTYSYHVPIRDLDACVDRIEQNLTRLISRAEEEGITVTEDDDFEALYRLHSTTMDRKDSGTYLTRDAFRTLFHRIRAEGLAVLTNARLPDGEAVATTLHLTGPEPLAHTVVAAATAEHQRLGTNPLLRRRGFELLHERGYERVDLTDASLNPVTRFKAQLGGELVVSLELDAPRSGRYRAVRAAAGGYRTVRGAAGTVLRRLGLRAGS